MNKIDRTNETRIMNNGLSATIVTYRNARDIDIEFSNGQIACNRRYFNFVKGQIFCPLAVEYFDDYAKVTNPNPKKEFSFLVDIDDLPIALSRLWVCSDTGYASSRDGVKLHRLIMKAKPNEYVDHIYGDKLDNRKKKMRLCTNAENCRNAKIKSNNTSGYKGVTWHKDAKKWLAEITFNYCKIYLGLHNDSKAAAIAYNEAASKYHGQFAKLNIIP